jgi:phosphohistidine phosphatase
VKRVWLLRHLKSSWDEPGLADHDRPLAPRGRKAADHEVRPDLVLCSTAMRARATLDLVAPALGAPTVEFEDGLYHAWADDLLERLRRIPPRLESVLLIGHNPGFHDLVALLAPPGPEDFPTGALVELLVAADDWTQLQPGGAELARLVVPRELSS